MALRTSKHIPFGFLTRNLMKLDDWSDGNGMDDRAVVDESGSSVHNRDGADDRCWMNDSGVDERCRFHQNGCMMNNWCMDKRCMMDNRCGFNQHWCCDNWCRVVREGHGGHDSGGGDGQESGEYDLVIKIIL